MDEEKSFYDKANEIRIDFLLSIMIKGNMSQEQFLKVLNQKIDESNYKEKERLKKYFYQVYTGKKEEY